MFEKIIYGYAGKLLEVNLTDQTLQTVLLDESLLREYIGGTCLGAKYLMENVPNGISWSDPRNIIFIASGPLGGTSVPGSGTFSVVTKGALTNGATSSQANGFFGAYMKFSGFDAIIIKGASPKWVYLYIHDGLAELRNGEYLQGKDTWETEDAIKDDLGIPERQVSVFCIGPAGENLVRFAAIVGDRGHVVAHNGPGAVMGSKKIKAFVATRGKFTVPIRNKEAISLINKDVIKGAQVRSPNTYNWGTSMIYDGHMRLNMLAIKNLTSSEFPSYKNFTGEIYRPQLEMKRTPCWACQAHHCHIVKVKSGPYSGYVGEEPEYEGLAAWGSLINQTDIGAAIMLGNTVDRLGMDTNESGWLISMLMECYEKGIISKKETCGTDLTWGNVEAVRLLLQKIATRKDYGNVLAEGVMRTAITIGGKALDIGVYVKKGHTPRSIDHRAKWSEMFDTATSNVGTVETGAFNVKDQSSPVEVSIATATAKPARFFKDSLGICLQSTGTYFTNTTGEDLALNRLILLLGAITGWDYTLTEMNRMGMKTANILRIFDLKQGIKPDMEYPSTRYGSAPLVEGGQSVMVHWKQMLQNYYKHMGWDENGIPLRETLQRLDIEYLI